MKACEPLVKETKKKGLKNWQGYYINHSWQKKEGKEGGQK